MTETKLQVNPSTLCFENMTPSDKEAIRIIARDIVFKGKFDFNDRYIQMWFEAGKFDDRQQLFVLTTVLPARFYASICGGPQ